MDIQHLVTDGQLLFAALIAVVAGLVSFASPCILPLAPGYLAYVSANAEAQRGARGRGRLRLVTGALLFVAGFTAVFVTIMAAAGTVGVWLVEWEQLITRIMGAVILVMGLVFMGVFGSLQTTRRMTFTPRVGLLGAPALGAIFAVGWTPCLGPTLTTIMSLSYQSGSAGRAVFLAILYSLGLGVPFILIALGVGWATRATDFMKRHIRIVNILGGSLLLVIGLLMLTGLWTKLMYFLQTYLGGYVLPI